MSNELTIPDRSRADQRAASDPAHSAWVRANAGSGKTYVLARRVLRLLVGGTPPQEVLCLTYTKAAAAEMRARVAKNLAEWTMMPDEKLISELTELEGAPPEAKKLAQARALFVSALETPGGLKINTIHAFCEKVLRRFPLEAGVPFNFTVIEDDERNTMIRAAADEILALGLDENAPGTKAAEALFAAASDHTIDEALTAGLSLGSRLKNVLADPDGTISHLRTVLGLEKSDTVPALAAALVDGATISPADFATLADEIEQIKGGGKALIEKLRAAAQIANPDAAIPAAWLTARGALPAKLNLTKNLCEYRPDLAVRIETETRRVVTLHLKQMAAAACANSLALLQVLKAVFIRYGEKKSARALLDYDDQVEKLAALLDTGAAADWVSYRLDARISHILVDESQDTNPQQWAIVDRLASEFFTGNSAIDRPRTVFAVGDEKQSIFSFQGANPALFGQTGVKLAARAKASGAPWVGRELKMSFRSAPHILEAVDRVFSFERAFTGLEAIPRATSHTAARRDAKGLVECWPLAERPAPVVAGDAYPLSPRNARPAVAALAEEIAGRISDWLDRGRRIAGTERRVRPGDILVLVQTRSPLFHAIIKALRKAGIANAGADKFPLVEHPAIMDLAVLGDFIATPADELALATVLRSPLIGISEAELEALCANRHRQPLWPRLKQLAKTEHWAASAYGVLEGLRNRFDIDRPYEFFARLLFAGGGLKAFHARMGPEVDDAIAEFLDLALDHERAAQPGLRGFLAGLRKSSAQTKRELSERGELVRVMTVHGAKGLEAPIVILADASKPFTGARNDKILLGPPGGPGEKQVFLWKNALPAHPAIDALKIGETEAARAEFHRKLYVALTRAENETYLTGIEPGNKNGLQGTWYDLVASGLDQQFQTVQEAQAFGPVQRFPAGFSHRFDPKPGPGAQIQARPIQARPITLAPRPTALLPSTAPDLAERPASGPPGAGPDAEVARRMGTAMHDLLDMVPLLPASERRERGLLALKSLLPGYPNEHQRLLEEVIALIERPDLADLFGPMSRAELPVAATATYNGAPVQISGRIDRLIVTPEKITIVDFKSDADPPGTNAPPPAAYVRQMGLYWLVMKKIFAPRPVLAALLWTRTGRLAFLDSGSLAKATLHFKLA